MDQASLDLQVLRAILAFRVPRGTALEACPAPQGLRDPLALGMRGGRVPLGLPGLPGPPPFQDPTDKLSASLAHLARQGHRDLQGPAGR